MLVFADPSEKNCLYNQKDKLKKINLKLLLFLSAFDKDKNIKFAHITKNSHNSIYLILSSLSGKYFFCIFVS